MVGTAFVRGTGAAVNQFYSRSTQVVYWLCNGAMGCTDSKSKVYIAPVKEIPPRESVRTPLQLCGRALLQLCSLSPSSPHFMPQRTLAALAHLARVLFILLHSTGTRRVMLCLALRIRKRRKPLPAATGRQ